MSEPSGKQIASSERIRKDRKFQRRISIGHPAAQKWGGDLGLAGTDSSTSLGYGRVVATAGQGSSSRGGIAKGIWDSPDFALPKRESS